MKIRTTKAAFIELIGQKGIYKKLGVSPSTVSAWKTYVKKGKSITLDKMEEMLHKAGWNISSEKVWHLNLVKDDIIDFVPLNSTVLERVDLMNSCISSIIWIQKSDTNRREKLEKEYGITIGDTVEDESGKKYSVINLTLESIVLFNKNAEEHKWIHKSWLIKYKKLKEETPIVYTRIS